MPSPQDKQKEMLGFYRAVVIEVDIEENKYGGVRVKIPAVFPEDSSDGLIAYPANMPLGGYNDADDSDGSSHYQGSMYVPAKNSWVWIFFEGGNQQRPFYFAPVHLEAHPILPENRQGREPHKVFTVVKTHDGRAILASDSGDFERVQLTGKKRQLSSGPEGDEGSVKTIDGNQTTILIDESPGNEKILIKTYKGDKFEMDIEKQEMNIKMAGNIDIRSDKVITILGMQGVNVTGGAGMLGSSADINMKALNINYSAEQDIRLTAGQFLHERCILGNVHVDGLMTFLQSGMAIPSPGGFFADLIGGGLGGILGNVTGQLGGIISNVTGMGGELLGGVMGGLSDGLGGVMGGIGDTLGGFVDGSALGGLMDGSVLTNALSGAGLEGLMSDGLGGLIGGDGLGSILDSGGNLLSGIVEGGPIGELIGGTGDLFSGLMDGAGGVLDGVLGSATGQLTGMLGSLNPLGDMMSMGGDMFGNILAQGDSILGNVLDGSGNLLGGLLNTTGSIATGVLDGAGSLVGGLLDTSNNIFPALLDGSGNLLSGLLDENGHILGSFLDETGNLADTVLDEFGNLRPGIVLNM